MGWKGGRRGLFGLAAKGAAAGAAMVIPGPAVATPRVEPVVPIPDAGYVLTQKVPPDTIIRPRFRMDDERQRLQDINTLVNSNLISRETAIRDYLSVDDELDSSLAMGPTLTATWAGVRATVGHYGHVFTSWQPDILLDGVGYRLKRPER